MKAVLKILSTHKLLTILTTVIALMVIALGVFAPGGMPSDLVDRSPGAASASSTGPDFMSWRLISQERVSDGGTAAVYELLLPAQAKSIENLEVFYTVKPWERVRRSRRVFGQTGYYTKDLSGDSAAPRLDIYYGKSARIEITAGALIDGRFQSARTLLNTYGNSDLKDPDARPVYGLPVWPGLSLRRPGFYRTITGEPIYFNIEADFRSRASVRAFDQGREVTAELTAELTAESDGTFSYTPPLGPLLASPGYSVKRDVVLVAALGDGGTMSYYLPVNRSYYGHLYLKPGLLVVVFTALATLALGVLAGRRFKWR